MAEKTTQTIAHQVGQLLIVGFDGTEMTPELASRLRGWQPAGVILFARNITRSRQTFQLLQDCQASVRTPLFTCVDMEGGRVDRFRDVLGATASAADVFATGQSRLFRRHGKIIGEACRALGFNTDFAPVVDLAFPAAREVLRSRAVSSDARKVVVYARHFLSGLRSAGVIGSAKHFPGLGEASLDTHHALPRVDKPWRALWQQDLYPYRQLRGELDMVLVAHASYTQVTADPVPASLSEHWITGILRKRVGYRGLVVSDDLEMGAVLQAASIEQAAVEHIRAGGDLCLICRDQDHVARAYRALIDEAEHHAKFARRVAEASRRVLAFKRRRAEMRTAKRPPSAAQTVKAIRALQAFNEILARALLKREPVALEDEP